MGIFSHNRQQRHTAAKPATRPILTGMEGESFFWNSRCFRYTQIWVRLSFFFLELSLFRQHLSGNQRGLSMGIFSQNRQQRHTAANNQQHDPFLPGWEGESFFCNSRCFRYTSQNWVCFRVVFGAVPSAPSRHLVRSDDANESNQASSLLEDPIDGPTDQDWI